MDIFIVMSLLKFFGDALNQIPAESVYERAWLSHEIMWRHEIQSSNGTQNGIDLSMV